MSQLGPETYAIGDLVDLERVNLLAHHHELLQRFREDSPRTLLVRLCYLNSQLFDLTLEGRERDAKNSCGTALIMASHLQYSFDMAPDGLIESQVFRLAVRCGFLPVLESLRQVLYIENIVGHRG